MNIELDKIRRILIIQYLPLGDVLLNTGYLPFLRKRFPQARIEFLVQKPYHKLLLGNPWLDDLVIFEAASGWRYAINRVRLFWRIYRRHYDLVIDQLRGSGSAAITLFSGARYRLGYRWRRFAWIYNIKVYKINRRYSAGMKFDLLKPLGIEEGDYHLFFRIPEEAQAYIDEWLQKQNLQRERMIVFSPGSPVRRKKWRLDNYAALGDLVISRTGCKLVLLWGPEEERDVRFVAAQMSREPIIAPPTDFGQAAALLKRADLLVCNDGGINHLAVAVDAPSLALFGSTEPEKWGAENRTGHYLLHNPQVDSWVDDTFGITPEAAFEKVKEILTVKRQ